MASFLPMGGFQLPFQRRLSRLYNDTKKSTDFVKEPVQNENDPEIRALHRKLRIQKDRLVTWGLEWSDPNQSAEIDESLSKAGLSEVVGSIMSTIKDILAEAEPLWQSSKRLVEGPRPSPDRKPPLVQWDRSRFQDLIRDLTASIDTLYDLSQTRSAGLMTRRLSKTSYKSISGTEDSKPFKSTRVKTPQQIDPQILTHLKPASVHGEDGAVHRIVLMSKSAYADLGQDNAREPWAPLLLEYAPFDPMYATTGIMPEMVRFEKLATGLQQEPQRAPGAWTGLPRLLGYFEDMENSRLGLVYHLPASFQVLSSKSPSENSCYNLHTLRDLLSDPKNEPPLEAKFRLASNLTNTIFDLHARGVTHGSLCDKSISFCHVSSGEKMFTETSPDIRRPLISSFELFPEDDCTPNQSPWRHSLDPRNSRTTTLGGSTDERIYELYSLAMVLLSIGLWTEMETLVPKSTTLDSLNPLLDRLAIKCGSLYVKAVRRCWEAIQDEKEGQVQGESLLSVVQVSVSGYLEACCILDGFSGLEGRVTQEVQNSRSNEQSQKNSSKDSKDCGSSMPPMSDRKGLPSAASGSLVTAAQGQVEKVTEDRGCEAAPDAEKPETKTRLYPHVPLAPEMVEKWNTIVMPQVNQALRHFYRKHPESVEISLESVGPSPNKTQPTVLVVCTSVGKVRAILKKRLGDLFDGSAGFGLKVCKGHVFRSRRQGNASPGPKNRETHVSQPEDDDETEPLNPRYQSHPKNGASIGAWIGDRHLPPASFGGVVLIDDKPYGMTVHHMLDDPDQGSGSSGTNRRSVAHDQGDCPETIDSNMTDDESVYELSDVESELYSDTDITSDYEDDESDQEFEDGDIPGIEPGCGDEYVITQPAFDDVEEGFYPCPETEDEDHLDTYQLGEVFASSGIRRKEVNGLLHEVDWALFRFSDGRLPNENCIPITLDGSTAGHDASSLPSNITNLRPTSVAPSSALPGMEVQCVARTSGMQLGKILPALTSVKLSGRTSPSHTYQVTSSPKSGHNLGIPGDSGAWVVDRHQGQLCGHVLAWSERKRVAYICPMDVLLLDVAQTLDATEVRLPGGEPIVTFGEAEESHDMATSETSLEGGDDFHDAHMLESDEKNEQLRNVDASESMSTLAADAPFDSIQGLGEGGSATFAKSTDLRDLGAKLDGMKLGWHQGIGVL